jgi:hypothetical protein
VRLRRRASASSIVAGSSGFQTSKCVAPRPPR